MKSTETGTSLDGSTIVTACTSYRAIAGTFMYLPINNQVLAAETGMFPDIGGPGWIPNTPSQGPVTFAGVTDGLSNTIMLGESATASSASLSRFPATRPAGALLPRAAGGLIRISATDLCPLSIR